MADEVYLLMFYSNKIPYYFWNTSKEKTNEKKKTAFPIKNNHLNFTKIYLHDTCFPMLNANVIKQSKQEWVNWKKKKIYLDENKDTYELEKKKKKKNHEMETKHFKSKL